MGVRCGMMAVDAADAVMSGEAVRVMMSARPVAVPAGVTTLERPGYCAGGWRWRASRSVGSDESLWGANSSTVARSLIHEHSVLKEVPAILASTMRDFPPLAVLLYKILDSRSRTPLFILDNISTEICAQVIDLARPDGFEPPTTWFEGCGSINRTQMISLDIMEPLCPIFLPD